MQAQKTKYESRNGKPNKDGSSRFAKKTPNERAKNGMPVNKMVAKLNRFAGGIIFSATYIFISLLQFPRAILGSSEALRKPIRTCFNVGLKPPICNARDFVTFGLVRYGIGGLPSARGH